MPKWFDKAKQKVAGKTELKEAFGEPKNKGLNRKVRQMFDYVEEADFILAKLNSAEMERAGYDMQLYKEIKESLAKLVDDMGDLQRSGLDYEEEDDDKELGGGESDLDSDTE